MRMARSLDRSSREPVSNPIHPQSLRRCQGSHVCDIGQRRILNLKGRKQVGGPFYSIFDYCDAQSRIRLAVGNEQGAIDRLASVRSQSLIVQEMRVFLPILLEEFHAGQKSNCTAFIAAPVWCTMSSRFLPSVVSKSPGLNSEKTEASPGHMVAASTLEKLILLFK